MKLMLSLQIIQAAALKWRASTLRTAGSSNLPEAFRAGANYIGGRSVEEVNQALASLPVPPKATPEDMFQAGAAWALRS